MNYTEQLIEKAVLTALHLFSNTALRWGTSDAEILAAVDWTSKQLTPQDDLETWASTAEARLSENAAVQNHNSGGER